MASFQVIGIIESIKYLPNNGGCFVFLSEYRRGYKKLNGERMDDKYLSWKCIYKPGLTNYINSHFNVGMIVEIKGEVLPYAIEHDTIIDGYSVIGQTINQFSVPRFYARQETRAQKDSQLHSSGQPNLEAYLEKDF